MEGTLRARESIYYDKVSLLAGKMNQMLDHDFLEIKYAEQLISDYFSLINEIKDDKEALEKGRYCWDLVVSEFCPPFSSLVYELNSLRPSPPRKGLVSIIRNLFKPNLFSDK